MDPEDFDDNDVQEEDRQLAFNTPDVSLNHSGMKRFLSCADDAALSLRVFFTIRVPITLLPRGTLLNLKSLKQRIPGIVVLESRQWLISRRSIQLCLHGRFKAGCKTP